MNEKVSIACHVDPEPTPTLRSERFPEILDPPPRDDAATASMILWVAGALGILFACLAGALGWT